LFVESVTNNLPGDYNFNGTVDAADYVVWRNAFGSTFNSAADGNGNGTIDQDDYTIWLANFGNTASPPAGGTALATIPEPSTVVLYLTSLVLLLLLGNFRRCAA
jgi:hypothetical protein